MDLPEIELLHPARLFEGAIAGYWPVIALAGIGTLGLLVLRIRRDHVSEAALDRISGLVPLAETWPIFGWAFLAALANIDVVTSTIACCLPTPSTAWRWSVALQGSIAVALILLPVGVSHQIARGIWRDGRPASGTIGALAAVAAVAADTVFVLFILTPMR